MSINHFTDFANAEKIAKKYNAVLSIGYKLDPKFLKEGTKYLYLDFDDVTFGDFEHAPSESLNPPTSKDVDAIIEFIHSLDEDDDLLVHCFAGYSRSPAATMIALCEREKISLAEAFTKINMLRVPDKMIVRPNDILLNNYKLR